MRNAPPRSSLSSTQAGSAVKDEVAKPIKADNVIGCDFGRTDIAVTSDNAECAGACDSPYDGGSFPRKKWSGKEIRDVRDKYSRASANLQKRASKGTRSSRRRCRAARTRRSSSYDDWGSFASRLKRLSGREKRFQRHINHVTSKTIVLDAKKSNSIVAIEDLSGIRNRTNTQPRSKTERRRSNSWAFYQLRTFLEYKGLINGVEVISVSPRYSSQTCHACMHLGLRSGKRFKCTNSACSWHGDADKNASYNLSIIGGVRDAKRL